MIDLGPLSRRMRTFVVAANAFAGKRPAANLPHLLNHHLLGIGAAG